MVMLVCVCLGNYLGGVEFFFFCWNPALEFLSLKGAIVQASQSFWESPDYWSFLLTFRIQKSVNFQNVDGHFSHFWLLFLHACCMAVHAHHGMEWSHAKFSKSYMYSQQLFVVYYHMLLLWVIYYKYLGLPL